jgi:hypothetical protein
LFALNNRATCGWIVGSERLLHSAGLAFPLPRATARFRTTGIELSTSPQNDSKTDLANVAGSVASTAARSDLAPPPHLV